MEAPLERAGRGERGSSAALAGAGAGGLLVAWAQYLPETSSWRVPLLYIAPAVSSLGSLASLWIQAWVESTIRDWVRTSRFEKAKEMYREALANPDTSPEHKELMREFFEQHERIMAEGHLDRAKELSPIDVEEIRRSIAARRQEKGSVLESRDDR